MGVNWLDLQLPQEVLDLEAANKRLEEMESNLKVLETDLKIAEVNLKVARANLKVARANLKVAEAKKQRLIDLLKSKGATDDEIQACLVRKSA